jgi:hypothetical protein
MREPDFWSRIIVANLFAARNPATANMARSPRDLSLTNKHKCNVTMMEHPELVENRVSVRVLRRGRIIHRQWSNCFRHRL